MNALTAHELEERLLDYVYDELSPEERAAFEAALPSAPAVAAEVAAMQQTRAAMSSLGPPPGAADLIGGMDAVFAEAATMAATMAAENSPPQITQPQPSEPSGFGAWLAKLGRSFSASLMTPAFGAMAAVLIVAGVAVIMSRSGKYPGEDRSAESQAIGAVAPVAVTEAPAGDKMEEAMVAADKSDAPELAAVVDAERGGLAADEAAYGDMAKAKPTVEGLGQASEANAVEPSPPKEVAKGGAEDYRLNKSKDAAPSRARADSAQVADSGAGSVTGALEWKAPSGAVAEDSLAANLDSRADDDTSGRTFAPEPTNHAAPPAVGHAGDASLDNDDVLEKVAAKPTSTVVAKPTAARPQTDSKSAGSAPEPRYAQEAESDLAQDTRKAADAPARPANAPSPRDEQQEVAERVAKADQENSPPDTEDSERVDTAQRIAALWATFRRQVEAGDVVASRKTLVALETLGADETRLKAAKAQVADLERRSAAEKKALPATRSTK